MPSGDLPWQSIVDAVTDGVVTFDADGVIVEVNAAFAALLGRSRSEVHETRSSWWDAATVAAGCAAARRDGSAHVAVTLTPPHGETIPIAIALRALPRGDGWVVGTVRDDRAMRELERSQQRWRSIAENPFDWVVVVDRDHRYQYVNHVVPGLTPEELIGKRTPFDFVNPEDQAPMRAAFERALRDRTTQVYQTYVPIVDRWLSTIIGPIVEDGEVVAYSLLTRDVTDSVSAVEALRRNEHRLELAVEGSGVGIFEVDVATHQAYFSPRVHELFGLADHATLNTDLAVFTSRIHGDDRERTAAALERAIHGDEPFHETYRICTASGEDRWLRARGRTVRDGAAQRFSGFVSDVTEQVRAEAERRKLEQRVQHVHRLETLGTVASGIAHEFNNLLVPMLGNAEHARTAAAAGEPIGDALDDIVSACHRARDLVARMLVFSRQRPTGSGQIDVVAVVREATTLVRASLPPTIELACRFPDQRPLITGDDGQLHQAIVNLCTNARQAIGNRAGHVQVVLEVTSLDPADARRLDVAAGPVVKLTVTDDGPGIPTDVVARVFDPFFTTRAVGEGTGLGLWIVDQIVRAQRGAIAVTSTPGHGARFELWFPITGQAEVRASDTRAAPAAPPAPLRILYVEDEAIVRTITARVLRAMNYDVVAVESADAALQRLAGDGAAFDLVLTDLSMPGLTGVELASRLVAEMPGLPVIIITGLGGVGRDRPANVVAVIGKPWTREELAAAIASARPRASGARGP